MFDGKRSDSDLAAALLDLCNLRMIYDSCTLKTLLRLLICKGETGLRSLFL